MTLARWLLVGALCYLAFVLAFGAAKALSAEPPNTYTIGANTIELSTEPVPAKSGGCWKAKAKITHHRDFPPYLTLGWARMTQVWCGNGRKVTKAEKPHTHGDVPCPMCNLWHYKGVAGAYGHYCAWHGRKHGCHVSARRMHFEYCVPSIPVCPSDHFNIPMRFTVRGNGTWQFGKTF